jgi:hypothetical protein
VRSRVLDNVYLVGRPPSGYIADNSLEEYRPVAGESDEERGRDRKIILLVKILSGSVPYGN